MPKEIALLRHPNYKAIVDDEDYEAVNSRTWYFNAGRVYNSAGTSLGAFLLGKQEGFEIDHIDRDPLNNQRSNLRFATVSQNRANRVKHKRNTSGYKGVSLCKRTNKWKANCAGWEIGRFNSAVEAARAYDKAALAKWGEFAVINNV